MRALAVPRATSHEAGYSVRKFLFDMLPTVSNKCATLGSKCYGKMETSKYLGSLLTSLFLINTFKYHVFAPMGRFQL